MCRGRVFDEPKRGDKMTAKMPFEYAFAWARGMHTGVPGVPDNELTCLMLRLICLRTYVRTGVTGVTGGVNGVTDSVRAVPTAVQGVSTKVMPYMMIRRA